jgi:predicted dehydrogenase
MKVASEAQARVGIIGCGNISEKYVRGMLRYATLKLVGCADRNPESAAILASSTGVRAYPSVSALLYDPAVDVVVNITPPAAHSRVTIDALAAGKHVYVEKPLGVNLKEGERMSAAARANGRFLGAAPDTFLGSAIQTARAALDGGAIGEPIGAVAFVTYSKAETWHPNPTFYFKPGGGPVLDVGPYYITALVMCLGPIARVSGFSRVGAPSRTVTAPDRRVETITVETPTHASASREFISGALATVMFSFDVWDHHLPYIEIYGQTGTLSMADPCRYDGLVQVRGHYDSEWSAIAPKIRPSAPADSPDQYLRGVGVADLVAAIDGAPHRASDALAVHVLEVLEGVLIASETGRVVRIHSRVERPSVVLEGELSTRGYEI